jgi:hypothetical protein
MFKASPADRSLPSLPDLDRIASQTRLVVRKSSRFNPDAFLQSLLAAVAAGKGSLNEMVGILKPLVHSSMARQSLHQRLGPESTAFLLAVLSDLMEQRYRPVAPVLAGGIIRRVLIEDSTSLVMPKANAAAFPAHGNRHGDTAGVKIDFAFDLLTTAIVSHTLHLATEQDKTIGKEFVAGVRQHDLVLRDMGYFILAEFDEIERRGAFWLSRLPLTTNVVLAKGRRLEDHLKSCREDVIDLGVTVGEEGKKCRLVAVLAARHAERRKKARERGAKPCPDGLVRDGWHLMLTNLPAARATVKQLMAVYRARWAFEIQFRAWKQALNLGKSLNRRSNEDHLQALVIAGMIAHQMGMRIAARLGKLPGSGRLSCERLHHQLATHFIRSRSLAETDAFEPDGRHITRDKRNRQSPVESGIAALT